MEKGKGSVRELSDIKGCLAGSTLQERWSLILTFSLFTSVILSSLMIGGFPFDNPYEGTSLKCKSWDSYLILEKTLFLSFPNAAVQNYISLPFECAFSRLTVTQCLGNIASQLWRSESQHLSSFPSKDSKNTFCSFNTFVIRYFGFFYFLSLSSTWLKCLTWK